MGVSPFDTHPVWNLVKGTPGNAYSLTLKFRDLDGVYPDSAPFVVSFTAEQVHYPIRTVLLACGCLASGLFHLAHLLSSRHEQRFK